MQMLLAIGAGGAVGAMARHLMGRFVTQFSGHLGFPYPTMTVNVLGSFLIGLLVVGMAARFELSQELRGFLVVGILGGFTTFSTFSLETVLLMERGEFFQALVYAVGSLILGVAAIFAGMWLGRLLTG